MSLDALVKGDEEIMEKTIAKDRKRMGGLSLLMVACLIVGMAGLVIAVAPFHEKQMIVICGFLWFIAFWAASIFFGRRIERIERNNDLVTYDEVLAFLRDGARKTDAAGRLIPKWQRALIKGMIGACVGAGLAAISMIIAFALSHL